MFVINPVLAALALAPVPFLIATATRYSRRNRPAEQEVQQRVGEVTASAEESISGIRIVKAFAREGFMLGRFRHAVDRVFDQSMVSTRLQSFYTPLMGFLPTIGHRGGAARRRPPGGQRDDQHRRVHGVDRLRDHALRTGSLARDVAEHGPARRRLGQPAVRDPRPRAVDAERARRAGASRRRRPRRDARRDAPLQRRRALADRHRPRGRARADDRAGRADRVGQDEPRRAARPPVRPERGEHP